jgi:signal transduction histidine kinase
MDGRADDLHFLAEAGALLAGSLDYAATLSSLARLVVPRLADWCTIYMLEEGEVRLVAAAHADPAKQAAVDGLRARRWPRPDEGEPVHPVLRVLRTGQPLMTSNLSDAVLQAIAQDDEHLRLLRELAPRHALIVPLIARGRTLGAISMVMAESGRAYDDTHIDLAVGQDLARRAAVAIDNALLYGEAQAAIRARDEFISTATHEIRAPLGTLGLQVQLLARLPDADLTPERLRPMFARCERQFKRVTTLLNRLFDFSRISAGRLDLRPEALDLAELAREVVARHAAELEQAGCQVTLRADQPAPGMWDRMRLDQVLTNLLTNAFQHAPGQPIEVAVEAAEGLARLSVTDHGPGISPEHLQRLFERFERGGARSGGLGLGLYISRKIIEAMGGALRVTSTPGQGACFVVELPR